MELFILNMLKVVWEKVEKTWFSKNKNSCSQNKFHKSAIFLVTVHYVHRNKIWAKLFQAPLKIICSLILTSVVG